MIEVANTAPTNLPPLYDDVFPALPPAGTSQRPVAEGLTPYKPADSIEVVKIPLDERRYQSTDESVLSEQSRVCAAIGKSLGVKIQLTNSKNNSLNVLISGPAAQVAKAKLMVLQDLQQQAQRVVKIPPEFHRFLIGFGGQRKRELESSTLTKIFVPPPSSKSSEVVIVGSPDKLNDAEREILRIVEYQSQHAEEKLAIPKVYHPFICGPFNRTLNKIMEKTGAKISIPLPKKPGCGIKVSGKKSEVVKAVSEINNIYKACEERCTTIPCLVQRDKHRLVIGHRKSGLQEIFDKTGVVVEPSEDPESEEFILRGYPEDLGLATTLIFKRASSSTTEGIVAPQRLHKLLIGKKGNALASILDGYAAVRVEFPNGEDKITVEGPPEEVSVVVDRLNTRVAELTASHHLDFVKVDPKYHSKLLGNGPDSISRYIRSHHLSVWFPTPADCGKAANEFNIFIEGEQHSVEIVKEEIGKLVRKWENEKIKDVIVEPRIQNLLRSGNPPPIRPIEEAFPEVEIRWPQQAGGGKKRRGTSTSNATSTTTDYVLQLYGVRDKVDSAAEKLNKLVKQITEENYEQEFRIFKDCLPRILGATIVNLLKETRTRIHYFPPSDDGSQPVSIIGRQEDVDAAVTRLEKLQKSMANIQETVITLPTLMLSKQPGDSTTPGARLRSIREQCEGVQLKTDPAHPRQLTISGPPEALEKAKALIDSMCAKMLERCTESVVFANPKFHGQLIGRGGSTLKKFREKHNVEVLFPDRLEGDPTRASAIHIIGEKEAVVKAVEDLEQTVKNMEDETDVTVKCEPSVVNDLWIYRSAFHYPELDRVKVIFPKSPNSPFSRRVDQSGNGHPPSSENIDTTIRIFGPKGCVEDAQQCIMGMIEDVMNQTVVKHPVTEVDHFQVLSRLRSTILDIQKHHKVLISLQLDRDGFREGQGERLLYGYIVLTGTAERIANVLKNEILSLLPVSQEVAFPREFYGKLFMVEQPSQQQQLSTRRGQRAPQRGGGHLQHESSRTNILPNHQPENGEISPKTRLNALRSKFNVSISVPPRIPRGADRIIIRGIPDAVEACKAELAVLEAQLQAEKAEWEARNYEDILNIEERYLSRIISGEKERLLRQHGVAIFTRGRPAATTTTASSGATSTLIGSETTTGGDAPAEGPGTSNNLVDGGRYAGYRLVSSVNIPVVLQGYKEKVKSARGELEKLLEKFSSFTCIELHIPSEAHARLIGSRHYNIRRLEELYDVDVEFPPRGANGEAAEVVLVMGYPDNVDEACNELINKANDIVSVVLDGAPTFQKRRTLEVHPVRVILWWSVLLGNAAAIALLHPINLILPFHFHALSLHFLPLCVFFSSCLDYNIKNRSQALIDG
ncbi:high density lipoprotein receptor hdl [Echinococcus multilocularis]|uniref:High density lipoprotein receptor hdl n=1 Tax=Echinococcus multilocularis TaxID=6211 RepID=A0A068Y5U6_ECHMU|nr:high density lipoprotein receptor hdl [Echinococcus multilocularis]